jgi:membrane protein
MRVRKRSLFQKFFADRGTHLAAMIAYFALLSLVPMLFLAIALLGITPRHGGSRKSLEHSLNHIFPGTSVVSIDHALNSIGKNAAALGIIGAVVLLWSSLSLFSVLESAFNIVYGRPNRPFLRGKALALVLLVASLVTVVASLVTGTLGVYLLQRYTGHFLGNAYVAFPLTFLVELAGLLLFLVTVYYVLTNVQLTFHDVLPGAVTAALILAATFQVLPLYLRLVSHDLVVLRALGGPAILLFWLYVMANVIVFGSEVNWWMAQRREARARAARAAPVPASEGIAMTTVLEPLPPPEDSEITTTLKPSPADPEAQDTAPSSTELR